jgi:YebC/PmpR family DNA-binding regulatory protein
VAGHSHWAGIKHKKALVDAKRGKIWGKLSKAIIVAAKLGGGDPDSNIRLRTAIDDAKAASMPKDNIARAIKRGTGELEGGNLEEIGYEGYGPGGVAILCEVLTDNRNRTGPEIRKIFEMSGGKLGATGCVAWMFQKKGLFLFPADKFDEDTVMEIGLEAGAEDVRRQGDQYEVTCSPGDFEDVKKRFEDAGFEADVCELSLIPETTADVEDPDTARKVLKLMERLDDHDDVQNVSSNFNIADEIMAEAGAE